MVCSQGVVVCAGDFNIRLNSKLDASRLSGQNNPLVRKVNSYMEEMGIIELHRSSTHYSFPHAMYTRIDYFFMMSTDRFKISECNILTMDLSDHSPVTMSLLLERKKLKTLWKFNSHLFNDAETLSKVKKDIKDYLELNDTGEVSPVIVWGTGGNSFPSVPSFMRKAKGQKLVELQEILKQKLQEDITTPNPSLKQENTGRS